MAKKVHVVYMPVFIDKENKKVLADGYDWDKDEAFCCVHGTKLRWSCDHCQEYFDNPKETK